MPVHVPFEEGYFRIDQAFIVTPGTMNAIALHSAALKVFKGPGGRMFMNGHGLADNFLLIELLEEEDALDVLMDLGPGFKYRLIAPQINAGKVFTPGVKSTIRFTPTQNLRVLDDAAFEALQRELHLR
jgi:hypothetical protein